MTPKILVVDDDPEMSSLLQRSLESEGRTVTAVASGAEAVAALGRDEFDV
ncbi:MAG: response regulator, partial [Candidatus Rokubacteria bacterium]|nr:response regulator [Candidatus Rokubacteria bacterium]